MPDYVRPKPRPSSEPEAVPLYGLARGAGTISASVDPVEPEVVSVSQFCRIFGLGRTKVYQLMGDGTLPSARVGKRRLLRLGAGRDLIARLEQRGLGTAV